MVSFGFHRDNVRCIDEENSPLGFDRNPHRLPDRERPCLGYDFTNMRIAVIQKTSIARFVTAPVPEVHRDPARRQSASTSSSSRSSSSRSLAAALVIRKVSLLRHHVGHPA